MDNLRSLARTFVVTARRQRIVATLGALLVLALVVSLVSFALASSGFPDVPASHPYYTAVTDLASRGIIGGFANGNFGPNDLVKRQQFAKMIVLALGLEVKENDFPILVAPFVDLGPDYGYSLYPHDYIAVCARNNITQGTDPTHFSPLNNISRAQLITMVVRAADNLAPGTLDPPPFGWTGQLPYSDPTHGGNIKKAEYNGLMAGIQGSGGTVAGWDTAGDATRGEVAQMLHNLLGKLTPATTTTTSASTTTTAITTTTTTTVPAQHYPWGATAQTTGLRITVSKPYMDPALYRTVNGVPDSASEIIMVEMVVQNTSIAGIWFGEDDCTLVDTSGKEHDPFFGLKDSDVSDTYPTLTAAGNRKLDPGERLHGYVAYAVPNGTTVVHMNHYANKAFRVIDAVWGN
jgi:hypothetical protein